MSVNRLKLKGIEEVLRSILWSENTIKLKENFYRIATSQKLLHDQNVRQLKRTCPKKQCGRNNNVEMDWWTKWRTRHWHCL